MGRVRSREHGVGAPEDPHPLLPRDPGGCGDAAPAEHPYRTHHAANPRPPDGSGASGSTVDRGAVLRQVGRIDRARHHVDRAEHAEGVRDPQRDTRAGRRAHLGSPSRDLFLTYADDGARVFIPEADSIWYDGFAYARGTIEFNLTSCAGAGGASSG